MTRLYILVAGLLVLAATLPGCHAVDQPKNETRCSSEEYAQFDFWVGEWRVTDEEGEFQGTNRIRKILDGCALEESWTGGSSRERWS